MQQSPEDDWTCPPKNRPHWLPDEASGSELSYLSWGYRWYGSTPISPSRHGGWHYFVSMEGGHDLLIEGRTIRAQPGLVCVTHPDCPIGHADQPNHRCRILTWIWRTPPTHSALHPPKGSFLRMQISKPQLRHVETLLANCRQAVAVANER
ncbi:MAG TPA: hypothetical protein VL069_12250, partial [Opitutus sp.]|nr:hypothetical protein [Opitutus sp.]